MKKLIPNCLTIVALAITGISLSGCGTIMNSHVHHMNNSELQLRRYQLAIRTNRTVWGTALDDWNDDMREKEAVEKELMRRGVLNPLNTPQVIAPTPQVVYGNPQPNVL